MPFEPLLKIESVDRVSRYFCTYWEKIMKKLVMAGAAPAKMGSSANAEGFLMNSNTPRNQPFFPVGVKSGRDGPPAPRGGFL